MKQRKERTQMANQYKGEVKGEFGGKERTFSRLALNHERALLFTGTKDAKNDVSEEVTKNKQKTKTKFKDPNAPDKPQKHASVDPIRQHKQHICTQTIRF